MEQSDDGSCECSVSTLDSPPHSDSTYGIDLFLSKHLDDVLNICDEFRDRFRYDPSFLSDMKCTDLTDLLIDAIFHGEDYEVSDKHTLFDYFINEYRSELGISYSIVTNFCCHVRSTFHNQTNISYEGWCWFCYHLSDMY
jgi:hypothetical protein